MNRIDPIYEAYLYQYASFPVVSVRAPMVISGDDDYTGRFKYHINRIINNQSIGISGSSSISYVTSEELANFLSFIGMSNYVGSINANNTGWLSVEELVHEIGTVLNKIPKLHSSINESDRSPYCIGETLKLSNELAKSIGYSFRSIKSVLPSLIKDIMLTR